MITEKLQVCLGESNAGRYTRVCCADLVGKRRDGHEYRCDGKTTHKEQERVALWIFLARHRRLVRNFPDGRGRYANLKAVNRGDSSSGWHLLVRHDDYLTAVFQHQFSNVIEHVVCGAAAENDLACF